MHPAHQSAEIVHVPAVKSGKILAGDSVQDFLAPGRRVAADVVVVHETGGDRHDQSDGVGVGDGERGAGGFGSAAFETGGQRRLVAQALAFGPRNQAGHARGRAGKRTFPGSVHDQAVVLGDAGLQIRPAKLRREG